MKIVYCLMDLSQFGGMERSICSKANYLAEIAGYDVSIVTTDQMNKPNFYNFSSKITFYDLLINYGELSGVGILKQLIGKIRKRKLHRKRLSEILKNIQPDVTISTGGEEQTFLYKIQDRSKKVIELHFCRYYKRIELTLTPFSFFQKVFLHISEKRKEQSIAKYDAFVVLTKEDQKVWVESGYTTHIIPNPLPFYNEKNNDYSARKVLSIGRLVPTKGYVLLIKVWRQIVDLFPEWQLVIFGEGAEQAKLEELVFAIGLQDWIEFRSPTENIEDEYYKSSVYVMSSICEGFGITLAEAMSCGLPCISFACPNGPSEIITNGEDGLLIECGDSERLFRGLILLIEDEAIRREMGENAKLNIKRFLPERIMPRWINLFETLTGKSGY